MKKYVILFFILFTGCSTVFQLNEAPKPSGKYKIGTIDFHWIDYNRLEVNSNLGQHRELMVRLWYPSSSSDEGERMLRVEHPELLIESLSKEFGLPGATMTNIKNIRSHSIEDIPPNNSDAPYPLILFSHGLGGMKTQNLIQIEELVSHGYIVAACDHTYDAYMTYFPDGRQIESNNDIPIGMSEDDKWLYRGKQLKTRSLDMIFLLNQLDKIQNNSIPSKINGIIDIDRIGIFGHSFGSATSIYSSYLDERIDACLGLDGWFLPLPKKLIDLNLNVPFLHLGQIDWDDKRNFQRLDKINKNNTRSSIRINVPGTNHFDYTDFIQYSYYSKYFGINGDISPDEIRDLMNFCIIKYFDYNLKDSSFTEWNILKDKFPIFKHSKKYIPISIIDNNVIK